jgi:hypothetical protein
LSFLGIDDQLSSGFRLAELLPTAHYCRKNIGYLHAIRRGATCLYETDDDNAPMDHWQPRTEYLAEASILTSSPQTGGQDLGETATVTGPDWVNVYRYFSDDNIWPRGLPLDRIHVPLKRADDELPAADDRGWWAPIQQGLADGSPDVDAIWRLVLDREFRFSRGGSVMLPRGQWCPFNTQTTWWWPTVFPLLYVPSYCSFRMCDIWKSFVAQRCLWELNAGVAFHGPEVWQERNLHSLMRDFRDEIPGYEQNHQIAEILESTTLAQGRDHVAGNLRRCYEALVDEAIFPEKELKLVNAWIDDVQE